MIDIEKVREALNDTTKQINLTGGLSCSRNLEQAIVIFQRIRDNQLPILYLSPKNSAIIVNAQEYEKTIDELERLQKREVAMKPFKSATYICPACSKKIYPMYQYCIHCGQKLDWSDEK